MATPLKNGAILHANGKHMSRCQTHVCLQAPTATSGYPGSQLAFREAPSRLNAKGNASSSLRRLTDLNELRDSIKSQSPSVRRAQIDQRLGQHRLKFSKGRHSQMEASQLYSESPADP